MNGSEKSDGLTQIKVRVCPACGVVNPSGPSESCPHLQLIRFDGITEELERLLSQVAIARRNYTELTTRLKAVVLESAREGTAFVETPRKIKSSDVEQLYRGAKSPARLALTCPEPEKKSSVTRTGRSRAGSGAPKVDPRQLDLIALSPSKGDA